MHDNSAIVRRFVEETINQGRIESAGQFVWEDVIEQVPFPGQGPGLEGLKDVLRGRLLFVTSTFRSKNRLLTATKL